MSLSDAALVKDNHVVAAGGVRPAFEAVRREFPGLAVEVECDTVEQVRDVVSALDAAGVSEDRIEQYAVDRDKEGPLTDEYDVELIATIVVERDGEEVARFEEEEPVPAAIYLADQLRESELPH
jgi:hypothetical protein